MSGSNMDINGKKWAVNGINRILLEENGWKMGKFWRFDGDVLVKNKNRTNLFSVTRDAFGACG